MLCLEVRTQAALDPLNIFVCWSATADLLANLPQVQGLSEQLEAAREEAASSVADRQRLEAKVQKLKQVQSPITC